MKILADFHHSSLLRSLNLLFDERFGMELFRPIGMEWFEQGFWAINDQRDTAKQFLSLDQQYKPGDGTPPLNIIGKEVLGDADGSYFVLDPGNQSAHRACTLEFFKQHKFDIVIASIPAHVPVFERLIAEFNPEAKLVIQQGNNWNIDYQGKNIMASRSPQIMDSGNNVIYYHQEFDLDVFNPAAPRFERGVFSFVNIIQGTGIGWDDYRELKSSMKGWRFKAFGGQCPDGNMNGPQELADAMRAADFIFHVKPGGDGFGHIIHNAYAVGRPVITRSQHYQNQLAADLLIPGTFLDIDVLGRAGVAREMERLFNNPTDLEQMSRRVAGRFREVVNYEQEAKEIWQWLQKLS